MKKFKGFTLIELLVVIAIIGLLSTLAVVALNSARQKARDAKRVADIKQVQTALELFYNDQQGYPVQTSLELGDPTDSSCLDSADVGFHISGGCTGTIYMGLVPANPTPNGTPYTYSGFRDDGATACTGVDDCAKYEITFTLEGTTGSLPAGLCTANQDGITCTAPTP